MDTVYPTTVKEYCASALNIYNTREFKGSAGSDTAYTLCASDKIDTFVDNLQQVMYSKWKLRFIDSELECIRCIEKNTYKVFDFGYGLYVFIAHNEI